MRPLPAPASTPSRARARRGPRAFVRRVPVARSRRAVARLFSLLVRPLLLIFSGGFRPASRRVGALVGGLAAVGHGCGDAGPAPRPGRGHSPLHPRIGSLCQFSPGVTVSPDSQGGVGDLCGRDSRPLPFLLASALSMPSRRQSGGRLRRALTAKIIFARRPSSATDRRHPGPGSWYCVKRD